jgi:hypothetical protein
MSGRDFGVPYNDELRSLMQANGLNIQAVAAHLDVSEHTVHAWTKPPSSKSHVKCPKIRVDTLKVILGLELADLTKAQRARVVELLKGA